MKKNVIVSLADANYFELLNELVNSIIRFEKSKNVAICILDAGLTEDQKSLLTKKVDEIKGEINQLENNLQFFTNVKSDNPLVKEVHKNIKKHKEELALWKTKLKKIKSLY